MVLLVRIGSTYSNRLTGAAKLKLEEEERQRIANLQQYHILEEEDESDFLKHRIEVETQSKHGEGESGLDDRVETIDPTLDMEQVKENKRKERKHVAASLLPSHPHLTFISQLKLKPATLILHISSVAGGIAGSIGSKAALGGLRSRLAFV